MQQAKGQVASITGLRAIAVLAVLLYHVDAAMMPGGFIGVDSFFVISGFVVAHSVMVRPDESWRSFVAGFYRRRLARLYPALLAYVTVATTLSVLFIPSVRPTAGFELFGASAALGISNFLLRYADGGYFSVSTDFNPFMHTWSLGVEEQYYVLFSLTALPLLRSGNAWIRKAGVALIAVAATASLALCAVQTSQDPAYAFFLLPSRLWELALGLLLRVAVDGRRIGNWAARARGAGEAIAWGALAVLLCCCWSNGNAGFPFPGALPACLATAALIGSLWLWRDSRVAGLLSKPLPQSLGLISYSLYLWHWGVIVFMRWTVGMDTPALKLFALAASLALGAASYYGVERTFQRQRVKTGPSRPSSLRYVAATALVTGFCITFGNFKPSVSLAAASRSDVWDPYSGPSEARPCRASLLDRIEGNTELASFEVPCRKPQAHKLFVIGDSHASAYRRMLWRIAETGDWDVRLYAHHGCGFVSFRQLHRYPQCDQFLDKTVAEIGRAAAKGDAIFLASLQTERYFTTWGVPQESAYPSTVDPAIAADNRERLIRLTELGLPIIVEDAKPLMTIAMFRCADWFNRDQAYCREGSTIERAEIDRRMEIPRVALHRVAEGLPSVTVWDISSLFCRSRRCNGYDGPYPLFYDVDHISAHANDMLVAPFLSTLQRATGEGLAVDVGVRQEPAPKPRHRAAITADDPSRARGRPPQS